MPDFPTTLRVPRYANAPGTPLTGQIYFDTTTGFLYFYNGTVWLICGLPGLSGGTTGQQLTKNTNTDFDWSWGAPGSGGGGTPAGSSGQVQWNNAAAFGGISSLTTDGTIVTQQGGTNFLLVDPAAITKKARFDLSNIVAGNTRIINVPNADSTLVQADTGAANNFLTGISAQGLPSKARATVVSNADIASLVIANTDTYLPGSLITIGAGDLTVGTTYHAVIYVSKTAAGTANPTLTFRGGTAGAVGDTQLKAFSPTGGTAVVDQGIMEVYITFTAVGASGALAWILNLTHNATTAGLWNTTLQTLIGTLGTTPGPLALTAVTKLGLSYVGGASASHTLFVHKAELYKP